MGIEARGWVALGIACVATRMMAVCESSGAQPAPPREETSGSLIGRAGGTVMSADQTAGLECADASVSSGAYGATHAGTLNGQDCYLSNEPGAVEKYTMPFALGSHGAATGSIGTGTGVGFTGSAQLDGQVHITVKPKSSMALPP